MVAKVHDPDAVTAVIPVHLPRLNRSFLGRALGSVYVQTRPVDAISVSVDRCGDGAAITRAFAVASVRTQWLAFLDSDDEWDARHIEKLLDHATTTGADVVYSGCRVFNPLLGGRVPLQPEWGRYGMPFDPELLRQQSYLPITALVRADLAQRTGPVGHRNLQYDDHEFWLDMLDLGARFVHLPEITWTWHHGEHTTSGKGNWARQ